MAADSMMLYDDVLQALKGRVRLMATEKVALTEALGRILAQDVVSDVDMPPFNKSAMDGFACRRVDLAEKLEIIETVPAGTVPQKTVGAGQCARIMTGSIVPDGADCVVQVEYTELLDESTVVVTRISGKDNICMQAEDVSVGDVVISPGVMIKPQHIGVMASCGCVMPEVSCMPRIAVMSTGDELVEPSEVPGLSAIRNSNSYQLAAQVRRAGFPVEYLGIVRDTIEHTDMMVRSAMEKADVFIMSGGVSMGYFDLVPGVLKDNGYELVFEKIAVKPGMPTVFGDSGAGYCFGLPGNPVSTFVIFDVIVKPFLYSLMGYEYEPRISKLVLAEDYSRKKTDRDFWLPCAVTGDGLVRVLDYHGPAHLTSLAVADGLICVRRGTAALAKGTMVDVRQI